MIRQLGIPTWFCSFSAAETKWIPLLKTLGQLVENMSYTDEEISSMSWKQKSKLIKSDPVTCARYFDFRFQKHVTKHILLVLLRTISIGLSFSNEDHLMFICWCG